ncbi:unnamed protein product [Rotaria sp. Silwood2]|nr:unnamed protein product [Rotaria sp. Silwood2]CAF4137163.1 unnamed protein product [Rotaria sp. Silwood2]
MINNIGEKITTIKRFRFGSGQILTLDDDKIEKIPYLAAMVSSADRFESARDNDGHYKLNPRIEYKHFSFALESLSFHSVRQLFTHLSKQNDVIPIIALLDFLGIGPRPDPTLHEVDSIFFSTLVYSPMLEEYLQIIKPSVIQDMAVRFAIAIAKEEYNFTNDKVIDQIYWFIMFILSAYELFGPRLRYHVYKIAEHCFSIFNSLLLKSLKKLIYKIEKGAKEILSTTNENNVDPDQDERCSLQRIFDRPCSDWLFFYYPTLQQRQKLIVHRTYSNEDRFWFRRQIGQTEILEPVYRRVLEIMYERLQSELCQCAVIELRRRKSLHNNVEENFNLEFRFNLSNHESLPKEICDLIKDELIQKEIREHILEELCVLTPKLEERYSELVTKIREYEQSHDILHEFNSSFFHFCLFGSLSFEMLQEEALCYDVILDKLRQGSSIEEEIHQRILDALHKAALQQFQHWKWTQQHILKLHYQLSSCQPTGKYPSIILNTIIYPSYQISIPKPLPKLQCKYSMRQLKNFRS